MMLDKVKWLHLELTSRCNASCPACPRNNNGYGLVDGLIESDLSLDCLEKVLNTLPNLNTVQYCGYRGDAIAAKNFLDSLDLIISYGISRIQIHTNGSLKTTEWWSELAQKLHSIEHEVWFTIDGLEDTHAIYRQNTDYNKIISNASAFIESGGNAVWQFIPFKHNQHQIKDVIRTSQQLGFKRIEIIKNARYPSIARHYKTGEPIEILPWTYQHDYDRHGGDSYDLHVSDNNQVLVKDCMHMDYPSVFLNYKGTLSSCCYMPDEDYYQLNINHDFENKTWKKQCLKWCGSKA